MEDTTISHVYDLHNANFRAFIKNNDYVAVGFVLPWQTSYERFSREFEQVQFEPRCTAAQKANHGLVTGSSDNAWDGSSVRQSRLHKRAEAV